MKGKEKKKKQLTIIEQYINKPQPIEKLEAIQLKDEDMEN